MADIVTSLTLQYKVRLISTMAQPLRLIFAGSGEFGLPTLKALRAAGHDLLLVVSQPDRPAGRGRKTVPTPIAQYAIESNLPLLRTDNINAESLPAADLLVVIAFGQKIAAAVYNAPRLNSINLHASILPKYRGAAPINWTILRGEAIAGNSIIRLADKMDAGAIVAQSRLPIGEVETAGELHDRLAEDGAPLLLSAVAALADGSAVECEQDHARSTLAPKLSRAQTHLDFANTPAAELALKVRGLYPWPGCRVRLTDAEGTEKARATLVRAHAGTGEGPRWHPGDITIHGAISLGDGSNSLEIIELQPEGRTPMSLASYKNGHPWMAGMHVESIV